MSLPTNKLSISQFRGLLMIDPVGDVVHPLVDDTQPNYLPDIHGFMTEDQEPMVASGLHLLVLMNTFSKLNAIKLIRGWNDMYIGGDCFWCFDQEQPNLLIAPDIFVVMGVQNTDVPRRRWVPWEENGLTPCLIIELISPSTFQSDLVGKKDKYEKAGVLEYFIFDPALESLQTPLLGYRLVDGVYVELQPNDQGAILSQILTVWLSPESLGLGMIDFHSGQAILSDQERADLEKRRADQEKRRADQESLISKEEKRRADEEKRRADEEKLRADEAKLQADEALLQAEQAKLQADEALLQAEQAKLQADEAAKKLQEMELRNQKLEEMLRQLQNPMPPNS